VTWLACPARSTAAAARGRSRGRGPEAHAHVEDVERCAVADPRWRRWPASAADRV